MSKLTFKDLVELPASSRKEKQERAEKKAEFVKRMCLEVFSEEFEAGEKNNLDARQSWRNAEEKKTQALLNLLSTFPGEKPVIMRGAIRARDVFLEGLRKGKEE